MKLKFINLLLASVLLVGSAQVFTSCKDNEADLYVNLTQEQMTLQGKIDNLDAEVGTLKKGLQSAKDSLGAEIVKGLTNVDVKINGVETALGGLNTSVGGLEIDLGNLSTGLESLEAGLPTLIANTIVSDTAIIKNYLSGMASSNDSLINALQNQILTITTKLTAIGTIENALEVLDTKLNDSISSIGGQLSALETKYNTVMGLIGTIPPDLSSDVDSIKNVLASYTPITSTDLEIYATKEYAQAEANKIAIHVTDSIVDILKSVEIADIKNSLSTMDTSISSILATLSGVNDSIADINGSIAGINGSIAGINGSIAGINSILTTLQGNVTTILGDVSTLQGVVDNVTTVLVPNLQSAIDAVDQKYDAEVTAIRNEAYNYYTQACQFSQGLVDALDLKLDDAVADVKNDIRDLESQVVANNTEITTLKNNISTLSTTINGIKDMLDLTILRVAALENRVTGVILEGTTNDIIGYFSTPLGVNSNILMQYCGSNKVSYSFPNTNKAYEYDGQAVLTAADLSLIGAKKVTIPAGRLMHTNDGNLGTIYFTLNPTNINLDGKTVALVNSNGQKSTVVLKNVRPCTKVKTFGYSRITPSANGFYMADATLPAGADIKDVEVTINPELASAAKEVFGDIKAKKIDAGTLAKLARGIYAQVNGILPALAIQTTWSEKDGAHSVNSQYGVAAAVFQPLSFSTLNNVHLPQIKLPDIMDKLRETVVFHFNTDGIEIDLSTISFDVDLSDISLTIPVDLTCTIDNLGELTVHVTVKDVPDGGHVEYDPATGENIIVFDKYKDIDVVTDVDLTDLTAKLNAQLANQFEGMSDQLQADIHEAFSEALSQIEVKISEAVDGMLESVQVKIDEVLEEVVSDLQDQANNHISSFFDKVENSRYYDAVEKLISKINDLVQDPNHYMQPVLLYKASGKYGKASDVQDFPTLFKLNSGNAVTLVATTYNAELLTPTYQKYIAVSNVYKYGDKSVNAANGDAKCLSLMKAANDQKFMNEVVAGERATFALNLKGGNGYVYEIVYQAVDYHGVVATNKYYVRVK